MNASHSGEPQRQQARIWTRVWIGDARAMTTKSSKRGTDFSVEETDLTTGLLDGVGGFLALVPLLAMLAPGFRQLDPPTLGVALADAQDCEAESDRDQDWERRLERPASRDPGGLSPSNRRRRGGNGGYLRFPQAACRRVLVFGYAQKQAIAVMRRSRIANFSR
jgi:hypothetical protein